jgi:hypothetical protein
MKLLNAEIERHAGYANGPELKLIVDKMTAEEDFVYDEKELDGCTLYFAKHEDGLVRFFSHNHSNERGFAGHVFKLRVQDGSIKELKGPWSSRAGVMNNYFPHCVDCIIEERDTGSRFSSAISLELATKAASMAGVWLVQTLRRNDIVYEIEEVVQIEENQ